MSILVLELEVSNFRLDTVDVSLSVAGEQTPKTRRKSAASRKSAANTLQMSLAQLEALVVALSNADGLIELTTPALEADKKPKPKPKSTKAAAKSEAEELAEALPNGLFNDEIIRQLAERFQPETRVKKAS